MAHPPAGLGLSRRRRRHRDRVAADDHLDHLRLVDDDRTLESKFGQRRRAGFGRRHRQGAQQHRHRHDLDTLDAVKARVGLGFADEPGLPQMRGRAGRHGGAFTEQGPGTRSGGAPVLGGRRRHPVAGVVPRRHGQRHRRGGGLFGSGGTRAASAVEVRVERQRLVGVAQQRGHASVLAGPQRVVDAVGQQRVRADLDEGAVLGAGGGDGLMEAHRVAQVVDPVVGVERRGRSAVLAGGDDDRDGRYGRFQVRQSLAQLGQDRIDRRMVGGHVDLDAAGQPVTRRHRGDRGVDLVGRPGDHRLAW